MVETCNFGADLGVIFIEVGGYLQNIRTRFYCIFHCHIASGNNVDERNFKSTKA